MQAFGACLHSAGLRDGPSWGWGILPRMRMCRELSKANGGAVWKTVAACRYLFLFITEDRRRNRCPAWGLRDQYGDQWHPCFTSGVISQTLMSHKLWGRDLSLDPVGWEVSCSRPQSQRFTDLLGAESLDLELSARPLCFPVCLASSCWPLALTKLTTPVAEKVQTFISSVQAQTCGPPGKTTCYM